MSAHVPPDTQVLAVFQSMARLLQQAPEEKIREEALRCEQLLTVGAKRRARKKTSIAKKTTQRSVK